MTTLDQRAAAILALRSKATKGPFRVSSYPPTKTRGMDILHNAKVVASIPLTVEYKYNGNKDGVEADAAFIASAHDACDLIRDLLAERARLRDALHGCVEHMEHSTPQGRAAFDNARAALADRAPTDGGEVT